MQLENTFVFLKIHTNRKDSNHEQKKQIYSKSVVQIPMINDKIKKHVLQWHICHKCNLRCSHCYQEDYKSELSLEELKKIFFSYRDFCSKNNFKGHINFTGGEPFLSKNFFPLLDLCEEYGNTFGILTNGTLLDEETVLKLKKYSKLSFVQISLDGTEKVHDSVRGKGNYKKAMNGFSLLKKAGIQSMAAFTCHNNNKDELKKVIREARKHKIDRFWADRMIPMGSSTEGILSTEDFQKMVKILTKEHFRRVPFSKTDVHLNRALQFSEGGNCYYYCSAGITLLTVLADGTLLPCRRLPIEIGNCLEKDITELYENSPVIKDLLEDRIPDECKSCSKAEHCRGGAKCLSYAVNGDYHTKDINCYIKY